MRRSRSTRRLRRVALVAMLTLAMPSAEVLAREPTPEPTGAPIRPVATMPALADGDVAVRFSLAPANPDDTRLTVLTRWRSCGIWQEDWRGREPADEDKDVPATVHVVTTDDEVHIRVDAGAGPDRTACDAEQLVRLAVALDAPLGRRSIIDADDDSYRPIINLVDSVETFLTYSCTPYDDGDHFTVAELLGPGLEVPSGLPFPPADDWRVVQHRGDELMGLGRVRANGMVPWWIWTWDAQTQTWISPGGSGCDLIADSGPNQSTATWRLRGKRPDAKSKAIKVWVREEVCNGRPLYGRVAQPSSIETEDGTIYVAYSMPDTVAYDGTFIDDPWQRWKGKPGVASRSGGGLLFVDCPGIGPAPYTFHSWRRLGERKLYDGASFPPKLRWPPGE